MTFVNVHYSLSSLCMTSDNRVVNFTARHGVLNKMLKNVKNVEKNRDRKRSSSVSVK